MTVSIKRALVAVSVLAILPFLSACGGDEAPNRNEPRASRSSMVSRASVTSGLDAHVTSGAVGRASGELTGGASSPRRLVEQVLDAVADRDTAALLDMLVDADEYDRIVYPELGAHYAAARDTRSETRQFLWENQRLDALKGMRSAMRELGGRRLSFVTIEFTEGEQRFQSYRLMEGGVVSVVDADGTPATLHMLGTMIEKSGRYKLLSYRDLD
jgi:hypothetical protein